MRKYFIVIFLIIGNILWGQDLLNQTVHGGDVTPLNNILTIDKLINFSRVDLRILRNTIYAKYGYSFNSIDLKNHFSQFSWYHGIITNVDNQLTLIDIKNIELIQRIEGNYPENNSLTNKIIGNWYYYGAVPSEGMDSISLLITKSDYVQIMQNGIYVFCCRLHIRSETKYYGLWSFENNTFETVPIGEHTGHDRLHPTYGKVNSLEIEMFQFNNGSRYSTSALFDHGMWVKE